MRSHSQSLLTSDLSDNIASHSYRVAVIGYFLAHLEKVSPYKVMAMCLFHDIPEARSGDQNWVHKKYVKVFEDEIITDQVHNLPVRKKILKLTSEYSTRETKESKVAKDADLLDQILLQKEYVMMGNIEAMGWVKGLAQYKMLSTKSAIKLADEIQLASPSDWWHQIWTSKRR